MAFSDWDITGTTVAVLNSGLSNPLPASAGSFCRRMGTPGVACTAFLNNPEFIGPADTHALRVRGCIRRSTNTNVYIAGLGVKIGAGANYGYKIVYDAGTQNYELYLNNGVRINIAHSLPGPPTSYWLSFQLEVFPIGAAADRVIVSQETSLGSESYTPILITGASSAAEGLLIPNNDARYAPWGGSTRCGFTTQVQVNGETYIDRVSYTKTPV